MEEIKIFFSEDLLISGHRGLDAIRYAGPFALLEKLLANSRPAALN
jgi:hypothetical protein